MKITYKQIREHYNGYSRNQQDRCVAEIFKGIEGFIKVDEIKFFYPKNIFNDSEVEFTLILKDMLVLVYGVKDSNVIYEIYRIKDISNIKFVQSLNSHNDNSVVLSLNNGKEIEYNSEIDANESWKTHYKEHLNEFAKMFLSRL